MPTSHQCFYNLTLKPLTRSQVHPPSLQTPGREKTRKKKFRQKCNKSREAIIVFSPCLWKWWVSQCSRGCKPLPRDPSWKRKAEPAPYTCCNVFCFRMLSLDTARYTGSVMLCVDADNTVWIYSMILHSHSYRPLPFSSTHFLPWTDFFLSMHPLAVKTPLLAWDPCPCHSPHSTDASVCFQIQVSLLKEKQKIQLETWIGNKWMDIHRKINHSLFEIDHNK